MVEKTTLKSQKNDTNVKASATALINSGINLASNLELANVGSREGQAQVEATCTNDGNKSYYMCSKCKKMFADEKGTKEIDSPEIIKKHKLTYVKAVAATYAKTGMKAHYKCSCGKLYTDANCKNETDKNKLIVDKLTVSKTSIKKVKMCKALVKKNTSLRKNPIELIYYNINPIGF